MRCWLGLFFCLGAAQALLADLGLTGRRQLLGRAAAVILAPAAALQGPSGSQRARAALVKPPPIDLKAELVYILRVQEACSQEVRLVKTGKYRELQRLNIKRAVTMMIDNYDLAGRFNKAASAAPKEQVRNSASARRPCLRPQTRGEFVSGRGSFTRGGALHPLSAPGAALGVHGCTAHMPERQRYR